MLYASVVTLWLDEQTLIPSEDRSPRSVEAKKMARSGLTAGRDRVQAVTLPRS